MTIAPDTRLHLAIGAVTALVMAFNLFLFVALGPLIAVLAAVIEIAGGWELVQLLRKEGEPSWSDAAVSVAGGAVVVLAMWALGVI